ncbi:hypothetical protein GCM10008957_32840 [Deinococcus ruber]|uniref:Uncharacterized protein n=1 Tax=Deinococcus ruber TaxID=1848197 RepID=A0A918CD33_9DEIO|nr:hypothetical protein GCM10008957_32840 [Deinococcus ruber]
MSQKLIQWLWPWQATTRPRVSPPTGTPVLLETSVPPPLITDWHTPPRRA